MKRRYLFLIAVVSLGLLASCYEDKGNYDYKVMNNIAISVKTDGSSFALGDTVIVKPEITFDLGKENSELEYKWTFDKQLISTEKDLFWIADTIASTKDLRLAILDKATGVSYFGATNITVSSPYVPNGWVVLGEKEDGSTILTYMRQRTVSDTLKCVVTPDVYTMINKEPLGSQPVSMYPHWVSPWDAEDKTSWLWITQKGGQGCVDISGSAYMHEGFLRQMFLGKEYPAGFTPQAVVDMQYLTMAIGEDGAIYTRVKENNMLFNSGYFLDRALTYKGEKVDGSQLGYTTFDEHGGMLLYDKNSGQYLHIADRKSWSGAVYSGKILTLSVDNQTYKDHPTYIRLDNMKDCKVHYIGGYKSDDYYGEIGYMSVVEKNGQFFIQNFRTEDYGGGSMNTLGCSFDEERGQTEINLGHLINGTSKNAFSLCRYQDNSPYMLISCDNKIYLYYAITGELYPYATFKATVTSIDAENYTNKYFAVGLENGEFYIISLDKKLVGEIINSGTPLTVTEKVDYKKILFYQSGLGRIVKVLYKYNTQFNEGFD